jgi:hypothetical protein
LISIFLVLEKTLKIMAPLVGASGNISSPCKARNNGPIETRSTVRQLKRLASGTMADSAKITRKSQEEGPQAI